MRKVSLLFSLAFALALVFPAVAVGQSGGVTTISIQVERSTLPDLPDNVAARLSDGSGQPISNAPITFWVEVEILGARSAFLGSATTDATGVARVPITPRYPEYRVRAVFAGDDARAPAESAASLTFPAERVYPVEISAPGSPLATLRTVMPRAMGIVVALLWVFFAAAVFYVVKTIHGHGQFALSSKPPQKEMEDQKGTL
jgi:hypothetical protein